MVITARFFNSTESIPKTGRSALCGVDGGAAPLIMTITSCPNQREELRLGLKTGASKDFKHGVSMGLRSHPDWDVSKRSTRLGGASKPPARSSRGES